MQALIQNLIKQISQLSFTIKCYLFMGIFWLFLGFLLSVWSTSMTFLPAFIPGVLDYGHLKPASSFILIFGAFLSFILGLAYSIMEDQAEDIANNKGVAFVAFISFKIHGLALLLGIISIFLGLNKGREYGETFWIVDNLLLLSFIIIPVLIFLSSRSSSSIKKNLSTPLIFLLLAFVGALLSYILGNFNLPSGLMTSVPLFTGLGDAAIQELYTSGFLYYLIITGLFALLYYYLPFYYKTKLYSTSIPVFVAIAFLFLIPLSAMVGLVYTPIPSWLQSIGIFSCMALNIAVIAGALNASYSVSRSSKKNIRSDALGVMIRTGILFLIITALARILLAPRVMQEFFVYSSFDPNDLLFNINSYAILIILPLSILALQKVTGKAYNKQVLNYLALFLILGVSLFYVSNLTVAVIEYFKISAISPDGKELIVKNWEESFLSGTLFIQMKDAPIWIKYLLSFRGLSLIGEILIAFGIILISGYVLLVNIVFRKIKDYLLPNLEYIEESGVSVSKES